MFLMFPKLRSCLTATLYLATLGVLLCAVGVKQNALAQEKGLLGYWRFDEGVGDEVRDSSGNQNDGQIHGARWVTGKFGTALLFTGQQSHVEIPQIDGLDGSNAMTVEAWVLWEGTGRYPNIITGGRWCPGGFIVFVSDDQCVFRMGKPGIPSPDFKWSETGAHVVQFTTGRWYHLVATFRRPVIRTFLDGKLVATASWDYPVGYSGNLVIGTWHDPQTCHKGLIDEVKIYNCALSAEEIAANYANESPQRMQMVGFNEKPYSEIPDVSQPPRPSVVLENPTLRMLLDRKARVVGLIDKRTGKDYCARPFPYLSLLRKADRELRPASYSYAGGVLTLTYAKAGIVKLKVRAEKTHIAFSVLAVEDKDVEQLTFVNLRVKPAKYVSGISGQAADEDFAFCLRTLNLQSDVRISESPPLLRATCFRKYGLEGAGAALVACSAKELRASLQQMIQKEKITSSIFGGPWALDAPVNRYSYLFASVGENNVDEWIDLARRSGIQIIHLCGWEKSLGHYEPRETLFPNGMTGLKRVADKIHAAGLKIGMHILTGCISPGDPFVSPVPDKRLAKDKTFTLATSIGEKDAEIPTIEPLSDMDTIWSYASRGNVVQIDDELVQFTGYTREPPYRFTGCRRGVFGTKAASHPQGTPVYHLFACYGAFYPDENTTLVDEVANCVARVVNECKFDLIYQDGSEGMPGGWHAVSKMRAAIVKRFDHPVRVEASEWGYHSWPFHSCIGAWDHPCWGLKRFVDLHSKDIEAYRRTHLLPGHLGWWVILGPSADHDGEFPDEIEYLCCRALGHNVSMSFQGISPGKQPWNARQDEYLTIIGRYERLRLAGYFSESVRARLRTPRDEFRLRQSPNGVWELVPTDYMTHKVTGLKDGSNKWTFQNRYGAQGVRLRIQALYGVASYDSPDGIVLADFRKPDEVVIARNADGVTSSFITTDEVVRESQASGCYAASSTRSNRQGAWAHAAKKFDPEISLGKCGALGVWIHGDGKGELLNLQLSDPPQYYYSAYDEHYVDINFTGWRYFELLLRERDAERYGDYIWPYAGFYHVYRTPLMRDHVNVLNLYYNNLPPNDSVKCYLSAIKALPVVKVQLKNPSITINGHLLTFPVTLESGQYIEMESQTDCRLFSERGEFLQYVTPVGEMPRVSPGENLVEFSCDKPEGYNARAKVTCITQGAPIGGRAPEKQVDWRWLRCEYDDVRVIQSLDGKQNEWDVICRPNAKGARLEVEIMVDHVNQHEAGYDSPTAITLESFDDLSGFAASPDNQFAQYVWDHEHRGIAHKPGVTSHLEQSSQIVKAGKFSLRYTATSKREDNAGWCAQGERFQPSKDLSQCVALGFWIHGDGNGEYLKLQLRDVKGNWQDMVTRVDFTGWKYAEFFLGSEANIDLSKIEYIILYYNNIPAKKTVTCHVDDIRALRQTGVVRNPAIMVNGRKVTFPLVMSAGEKLVYRSRSNCVVRTRHGVTKEAVKPTADLPLLQPGRNRVVFQVDQKGLRDMQMRVGCVKVYE